MAIAERTMTLADFLALPEEKPSLELFEGMVSQKVSPKIHHSWLQVTGAELFNTFSRPDRLGLAFTEIRATYGGSSLVPDIGFFLWDRIPFQTDGKLGDELIEPPDIAVEIVSPEQSGPSLVRKCLWYVEHGVRIALLVDPGDESVVIFRPGVAAQALTGDGRIDIDGVLPGFELTAAGLFASLYPGNR